MAIKDYNGSAWSEIGKVYDHNGSANTLIYTAETPVTLTNYGKNLSSSYWWSWSDTGYDYRTVTGVAQNSYVPGRFYLLCTYRVWAYSGGSGSYAWASIRIGSTELSATNGVSTDKTVTVDGIYTAIADSNPYGYLYVTRNNTTQGGACLVAGQIMAVPLSPLENALGRQISAAEFKSWYGTGWSGSKTVSIQT